MIFTSNNKHIQNIKNLKYGKRSFSMDIDGEKYKASLHFKSLLGKTLSKKMTITRNGVKCGCVHDMKRETRKEGVYGTCIYINFYDCGCVAYLLQQNDNCAYEICMMHQPFPWSYATGARSVFTPNQKPIAHGYAIQNFDGFEFDVDITTNNKQLYAMCVIMMAYLNFTGFKRLADYKQTLVCENKTHILEQDYCFYKNLLEQVNSCRALVS